MESVATGQRDDYGRGQVESPERRELRYGRVYMPPPRGWACTCTREDGRPLLRKHRHTEPSQCMPDDDVLAYWLKVPTTTYRVVRPMAWMAKEWAR